MRANNSIPTTIFFTLLFFLLFLTAPGLSLADEPYKVGFRTIGFSVPESGFRLDVNVWYPSIRPPRELQYSPWTILASRNGKAVEGQFPLLILSHPSPGTRFSYHDTCAALAQNGYVVCAPTHPKDCMDNMQQLFTWEQLSSRAEDVKKIIELIPKEQELGPIIDLKRIGLIGFGAGGTMAMLLGGAMPDCVSWPDYCPKAGKNDIYCNPWSREKINNICIEFPLRKSLRNPDVKAIVAISPGFGMLFSAFSFTDFRTPLLIISAEKDTLNNRDFHADVFSGFLRERCKTAVITGADQGSLMAPCPESLANELSDLCRSVSLRERKRIHKRLWQELLAFFGKELAKD
ncbi:MAG: dienelactone hydrolase family protein [Desulfovibrio sp.]|nr:dienelactone hydrolase family protein [Desulfovibrio sp.]